MWTNRPRTAIHRPSMMKEVQNPHRSKKRQAHQRHKSNEVPIVASQRAITPMADEVCAAVAARATQIEQLRCLDTEHPADWQQSSLIHGPDRRIPSPTHRRVRPRERHHRAPTRASALRREDLPNAPPNPPPLATERRHHRRHRSGQGSHRSKVLCWG
jgi:hypothetical protein